MSGITPYLCVDDGSVGHAELSLAGDTFYLSEAFPEIGVMAPRRVREPR